jgi:hypothetical protein
VSAVPDDFMRTRSSDPRRRPGRGRERHDADTRTERFWQWFALLALLFCWIAEATMCAERGF